MMFILYDIFYLLFTLIYAPILVLRGKWHRGIFDRFQLKHCTLSSQKSIWIHAVSVGEVLAAFQLVEKILKRNPSIQIVMTTVTKTGYEILESKKKDSVVGFYAPADLSWVVKDFIKKIKPAVYLSTETEIWPNLFSELIKKEVPIIIVNGRISDKGFKGYKRAKIFLNHIIESIALFCMQSTTDTQRIVDMGAKKDRVKTVGNIKFDISIEKTNFRKSDLGFEEQDIILVAGSTHQGEEDILLRIFSKLKSEFRNLKLVLAPRHIERTEAIVDLVENSGLKFAKLSSTKESDTECIIVDTIGKLRGLYAMAQIVFIGKTLCKGGGQNVIEPSIYGKPVFVGPLTQNFKDVVCILKAEGAIIQVQDEMELEERLKYFLNHPKELEGVGIKAKQTIMACQGATDQTMALIQPFLS